MRYDRLADVFIDGPLQIYIGTLLPKYSFLQLFMIFTGLSSIVFNGHNFLYIDAKVLSNPLIPYVVHPQNGKYQIHRVWNLLVMYPIFYIVSQRPELQNTGWILTLFRITIIIGFLYNLYYFIQYL